MKKKTYLKHKKAMRKEMRNCKRNNRQTIVDFIEANILWITHQWKNGKLGSYYSEWLRCV